MPRGGRVFQDQAALQFGAASTHRVVCGKAAILNNLSALSCIGWVYIDTLTQFDMLFDKFVGSSTTGWTLELADNTGNLEFIRGYSTAQQDFRTSGNPLGATGRWVCAALTVPSISAAHIYVGDQVTLLSECAYALQTAGTGSLKSDSAVNMVIGNNDNASPNRSLHGRIAAVALFNRVLSLPELQAWQFTAFDESWPAVMGGCIGLWYPGDQGLATVIDYSGFNNTGVLTGLSVTRGPTFPVADLRRRLAA